MSILPENFYLKNTETVAENLLGCILCRQKDNKIYKGIITETEAYTQDDPACHAFGGKTPRNSAMFNQGGIAYVYFIYGMYHCMNVVTEEENRGCAVLIRALEPIGDFSNTNGPAKLCKTFDITRTLNGTDLTNPLSLLRIEEGEKPENIVRTTRIGISKAQNLKRRFYIKDNKWISKK